MPAFGAFDLDLRDRGLTWRARRRRRRDLPAFAAFGPGSELGWPRTVTAPERIEIGAGVHLGDHVWLAVAAERAVQVTQGEIDATQAFDPRLRIGDRTRFGRDLTIACLGHITIGADVLGGDRILIGDTYHDYRDPDTPIAVQPMATPRAITIGDGAFLGTGAIVNPGVTIGAGAIVGAGAVVTRDVPDRAVVSGSPGRVVRVWGP